MSASELSQMLGVAPAEEPALREALLSILSSKGRPALLSHLKERGLNHPREFQLNVTRW